MSKKTIGIACARAVMQSRVPVCTPVYSKTDMQSRVPVCAHVYERTQYRGMSTRMAKSDSRLKISAKVEESIKNRVVMIMELKCVEHNQSLDNDMVELLEKDYHIAADEGLTVEMWVDFAYILIKQKENVELVYSDYDIWYMSMKLFLMFLHNEEIVGDEHMKKEHTKHYWMAVQALQTVYSKLKKQGL